jgi:hypothetical protein
MKVEESASVGRPWRRSGPTSPGPTCSGRALTGDGYARDGAPDRSDARSQDVVVAALRDGGNAGAAVRAVGVSQASY